MAGTRVKTRSPIIDTPAASPERAPTVIGNSTGEARNRMQGPDPTPTISRRAPPWRVVAMVLLLAGSTAVLAEGFRGQRWGASLAALKSEESGTLIHESATSLTYAGDIAGMDVAIRYEFRAGALVSGAYVSLEKPADTSSHIEDYRKVKSLLARRYGKPRDRTLWKNDLYKDRPAHWGTALALGHLVFVSEGETETTKIRHGLFGDDSRVTHLVIFDQRSTTPKATSREGPDTRKHR